MLIDSPTHAGGVVFRDERLPLYLVIRPRRRRDEWVLPKGHIEAGEEPQQTAIREVREEAGVNAEIVAPIGALTYATPRREIRGVWFLMRHLGSAPPSEEREVRWLPYPDALRHLTFEGSREILERAEEIRGRVAARRATQGGSAG